MDANFRIDLSPNEVSILLHQLPIKAYVNIPFIEKLKEKLRQYLAHQKECESQHLPDCSKANCPAKFKAFDDLFFKRGREKQCIFRCKYIPGKCHHSEAKERFGRSSKKSKRPEKSYRAPETTKMTEKEVIDGLQSILEV